MLVYYTNMTNLQKKAYALLRTVPVGRVTTYKALANAVGTRSYRAIGQFMRNNPYAFMSCTDPDVRTPCHRVVSSNGSVGGFMGSTTGTHVKQKVSLLKSEGVTILANKVQNFAGLLYTFSI